MLLIISFALTLESFSKINISIKNTTITYDQQSFPWHPHLKYLLPLKVCPLHLSSLSVSITSCTTILPQTFITILSSNTCLTPITTGFHLWAFNCTLCIFLLSSFLTLLSQLQLCYLGYPSLLLVFHPFGSQKTVLQPYIQAGTKTPLPSSLCKLISLLLLNSCFMSFPIYK